MDMLETTNITDVRQKQGSQYPANGSTLIGLGTGVRAGAEQGRIQRKKLRDSRVMHTQANSKKKKRGKQIWKTETRHRTVT